MGGSHSGDRNGRHALYGRRRKEGRERNASSFPITIKQLFFLPLTFYLPLCIINFHGLCMPWWWWWWRRRVEEGAGQGRGTGLHCLPHTALSHHLLSCPSFSCFLLLSSFLCSVSSLYLYIYIYYIFLNNNTGTLSWWYARICESRKPSFCCKRLRDRQMSILWGGEEPFPEKGS